ncbi:hypothetical protein [Litoribacillus peritrichatus]|uniref:CARDB domain-containing protein n=1 Tax=Litoribacillus peritrichatus TaxID=718191 RepID=A0ABP7MV06_9GAMM
MKLFKNKNKVEPFAIGLVMLGSVGLVQAQENNHTYLVSVQDSTGEHLCNGSYIGDNQILMSPDCRDQTTYFPTPIPIPSQNTASIDGNNITPTPVPIPIPLPGIPTQVSFNLPDGSQSLPQQINQTKTHPYSGDQLIAVVDDIPEGLESLTLASDELIKKLENNGQVEVTVVGRYYNTTIDEIGEKAFRVGSADECPTFTSDPLAKRLCLIDTEDTPFPTCTLDPTNKSTGAPVVYDSGNDKFLLGYKKKTTNFLEDCNHWAASSRYLNWLNLTDAKQAGLSIATAYDLGERPINERTNVSITIQNQSDEQSFDISNPGFVLGSYYTVSRNNCQTLQPGDSCEIKVYGKPVVPIKQEDLLTFDINGETAGTYVVSSSIANHYIRSDRQSRWSMKGWSKSGNDIFGNISFKSTITKQPALIRDKHVVDPKSISITYRATGTNQWLMTVGMTRMGLFGDAGVLTPVNMLPGTGDQWVTKTFEVLEPGTYQASISQGSNILGSTAEPFGIEISDICFNDCSE